MCGRYGVEDRDGEREIFPGQRACARCADGVREMVWGFRRLSGHGVLVNARAETAGLKSTFAPCLQAGRCIVDASCFFEWRHAQGAARGEKYRVARADAEPLHMAALHDGNGHFVILTQAANEQMAPLHDRMPVLLHTPELETLWLQSADMAQAVLDSLPAPALCMTPASPRSGGAPLSAGGPAPSASPGCL